MLPILYQSNHLTLYSYPLLMGLGWGIAYQIFFSLIPPKVTLKSAHAIFWGVFIWAWIGSKILFYLTLPEIDSAEVLSNISFWTGGGFVFYGGFLAGVSFLLLYHLLGFKLTMEKFWPIMPALIFGHAIGRLGCFLAGCCYGAPTTWAWGVFLHDHYRHPTQLIEALSLLTFGFYILKSHRAHLLLISYYLLMYGSLRFLIEALRGDEVRGLWGPLTPSQWISCLLVLAGGYVNLRHRKSAA